MNIMENLISFLQSEKIGYELFDDKILFDFQGYTLVVQEVERKKVNNFSIGIPFIIEDVEEPINPSKELIIKYLTGKENTFSGSCFFETVENNNDGSFSPENFITVAKNIISKDYSEELNKAVDLSSNFFKAMNGLLNTGADLLGSVVESIDSQKE